MRINLNDSVRFITTRKGAMLGLGDGHTETLATKIHSRMTHRLREIMGTSRLTERPDCSPPSNDSQLLRLFSEELANIHRRLVPVGPDYRTPARDVHRG